MQYSDGRVVAVGDRVKLWSGRHGTVVCSLDTNEYAPQFSCTEWKYLKKGIIIKSEDGDIFHYTEPDEDLELIAPNEIRQTLT